MSDQEKDKCPECGSVNVAWKDFHQDLTRVHFVGSASQWQESNPSYTVFCNDCDFQMLIYGFPPNFQVES